LRLRVGEATGLGEVVVAPGDVAAAWAELERRASALAGTALPVHSSPAAAVGKALKAGALGRRRGRAARSVDLAVELATLDLLAKLNPGSIDGDARPASDRFVSGHPEVRLPAVMPDADGGAIETALSVTADSGVLKLRTTGDAALDAAWLRHLSIVEQKAGRHRPLWLNCRARLAERDAAKLVHDVASWLAEEASPPRVLLEEPVTARDGLASLRRLQRMADEAVRAPATGGRRLVVMAGRSVRSTSRLRTLAGDAGGIGGVVLSVPLWGSWGDVQEAARLAKQMDPSLLVVLAGPNQGSEITEQASAALARATPEIDLYVAEPRRRWPRLLAASGPGSGTEGSGVFPPL